MRDPLVGEIERRVGPGLRRRITIMQRKNPVAIALNGDQGVMKYTPANRRKTTFSEAPGKPKAWKGRVQPVVPCLRSRSVANDRVSAIA